MDKEVSVSVSVNLKNKEALEQIIQASFSAGWDLARFYPWRRRPELIITWEGNAPKIAQKWGRWR